MPSFSTVSTHPGIVTPSRLSFTTCPSKCFQSKSNPTRACTRVMRLVINRSSPILVKVASALVLMRMRRSPGSPSTTGSPSSKNKSSCPSGAPASISTCKVPLSRCSFTLGHSSHSSLAYCWNIPGPICFVTMRCLQLHLRLPFAGTITFLSRATRNTFPKYKSAMLTSRSITRESPFGVSGSCCCPPKPPPKPPPKNWEKMSLPPKPPPPPPPDCCSCCFTPSSPCRSYTRRFSTSESTPYAFPSSANWLAAFSSPWFLSGWYFSASLRYARLIWSSLALRVKPRVL
mmetsp:Transcript_7382/g.27823  ORF Transcript_7382/g.27823 Transcript_7382/m.27823 type:complete len:288 (-) Transcript_7382:265-1128(-)